MSQPLSYEGKKVVLTGGASGVGAAAVQLLIDLGCTDLTVLDVQEVDSSEFTSITTDMANPDSIDAAVAQIGDGVDVLFNNAGIAGVHPAELVLRVNYLGLRRLTEGLLPTMTKGGAIVNTASIAGAGWQKQLDKNLELIAIDDWQASLEWIAENAEFVSADPYGFSKQLCQVWTMYSSKRSWMDFGVRTNAVCPAPVDTSLLDDFKAHMTEKVIQWTIDQTGGTILTAQDIAHVLIMLGSDASYSLNGQNIAADNGFMGWMATGQVDFSGLA